MSDFFSNKLSGIKVLALAAIVIGLAACTDENGAVIPLGAIAPTYSGEDVVTVIQDGCSGGCDGDFGSVTAYGIASRVAEGDLAGAFDLFFGNEFGISIFGGISSAITGHGDLLDAVSEIPDETYLRRSFSVTETVNCNSDDGDEGDADDGTISQTAIYTASFDNEGNVDTDLDEEEVLITTYNNCTIAGDLFLPGMDPAIHLNGTIVFRDVSPAEYSAAHPHVRSRSGVVQVLTDLNDDETFGEEFWGEVVVVDGEQRYAGSDTPYDGESYAVNGGACIGAGIAFGPDPYDDDDDGCREDPDDLPEGFIFAGACEFLDC